MLVKNGRLVICLLIILLLAACGGTEDVSSPPVDGVDEVATETTEPDVLGGLLSPESTPGEVYFAPFPLDIALDGDVSDWEAVPRVTMPEGDDNEDAETAVSFAAAANDDFFYFMAEVTDPNVISGEHGTNYWNEDSVEFYINATDNLELTSYKNGVAQVTIPPLNADPESEDNIVGGMMGDTAEAQVEVILTDAGYVVETAVPLQNDVWDIQVDHGNVIGFQVHLNGASQQNRDLKLIWSIFDTSDNSYQNPSLFGQLVFFEIGQTDVVANLPEPEVMPTRPPVPDNAPYKNPDLPVAERVDDLLARMSLEDKLGQMTLIEKNSIEPNDVTAFGIGGLLSGRWWISRNQFPGKLGRNG